MSSYTVKIQHDIINTLGNAINPLSLDDVVHEVVNRGFKQQRVYRNGDIVEVLESLVTLGFVTCDKGMYEWVK